MSYQKYGAKKTQSDGFSFASKLEAAVYQLLRLMALGKQIDNIECQVQVELSRAKIVYKPDFRYLDLGTGETHYAEAKGFETPEWRIKRRLWLAYGPGPLYIWNGHHSKPSLKEILTPRSD